MSSEYISCFALVVSLLSFWLAFRNRQERIKGESHLRYLEAHDLISRGHIGIWQAEDSFREFWRLAFSHAKIKCHDFDELLEQFKLRRETITSYGSQLELNKKHPSKIEEISILAAEFQSKAEPLMVSLQENLTRLRQEIESISGVDEHIKIEKLRTAISHIKQHKKF